LVTAISRLMAPWQAAMIYKRFGKWWGLFSLIDLLGVNFLLIRHPGHNRDRGPVSVFSFRVHWEF
jgi:hypothetical protein